MHTIAEGRGEGELGVKGEGTRVGRGGFGVVCIGVYCCRGGISFFYVNIKTKGLQEQQLVSLHCIQPAMQTTG